MKIRFKNPPINELAIGVFLGMPKNRIRNEHIGLLWSHFRSEFPNVVQAMPIPNRGRELPALETKGEVDFFPMPRFWFVSEDDANLIQVQENAFFLNWRKTGGKYPHFSEQLKPCFDEKFEIYKKFLNEELGILNVTINLCELTYVDMIESCDYWQGPQDTSGVIPSFVFPVGEPDTTSDFNYTFRKEIEPNLQLQISIKTAESATDLKSRLLILEFRAFGQPITSDKNNVDEWYAQAHDTIITQFLNMTDKNVQQIHWKQTQEVE